MHRYIASVKVGRYVTSGEHVHHINKDRSDNSPDNLEVLTASEHRLLHISETGGSTVVNCAYCGKEFKRNNSKISRSKRGKICCSDLCRTNCRRVIDIDPNLLATLVWEKPTTLIAKDLGVSDTAVSKYCKKHCITKPPRGYWAKTRACCSGVV